MDVSKEILNHLRDNIDECGLVRYVDTSIDSETGFICNIPIYDHNALISCIDGIDDYSPPYVMVYGHSFSDKFRLEPIEDLEKVRRYIKEIIKTDIDVTLSSKDLEKNLIPVIRKYKIKMFN